MMLSLTDLGNYSLNGLNSICFESKTTIINVIKELKKALFKSRRTEKK